MPAAKRPPPAVIRIRIERAAPLAGTAATEGGTALAFEGWLELLHVLATLIGGEGGSPGEKPAAPQDPPTKGGRRDGRTDDGDAGPPSS